jgi:hydrogenase nickel incorporation protein HypB
MCGTCGCSDDVKAEITDLETGARTHVPRVGESRELHGHPEGPPHDHPYHHPGAHAHRPHDHDSSQTHTHSHAHEHPSSDEPRHDHLHGATTTTVALRAAILGKNDALAARNRAWLAGRQILALNLVSSPGSGKTSLLERMIRELGPERPISVVEGDQRTTLDAERIRAAGAPSVQVNTGTGCHLEADMVWEALRVLRPAPGSLVLIENVGNLVCPALFDLGESARVAILSVTEGEDKPAKYPHIFQSADLVLLNKIDLLPHLDFDVERCVGYAKGVNPEVQVVPISVKTGAGLDRWYDWLRHRLAGLEERAFD